MIEQAISKDETLALLREHRPVLAEWGWSLEEAEGEGSPDAT